MTNLNVKTLALLSTLGCFVTPLVGSAQNPFGDDAGGGRATSAAVATGGGANDAADNTEADPLVKSIVDAKQTSPEDLVRSIEVLLDYGRPDVAKTLLEKLTAQNLTPSQLVALHTRLRSAIFFRIAREEGLQPEGAAFEKSVLEAARRAARDQARLAALIRQLSDPDPAQRHIAMVDFRDAQDAGINALLQVLGDASRTAEHRTARDALVEILTPPADVRFRKETMPLTEMVVSAAATSDPALRLQVLAVLGRLAARQATPFLVRPALASDTPPQLKRVARQALLNIVGALPTPHEAEIYLERQARKYLADQRASASRSHTKIAVWDWDEASRAVVARQIDLEHSALLKARRVTRELYLLNPDKRLSRNLYLATALQSSKILGGLSQPLANGQGSALAEMSALGQAAAEEVCEFALENGQIAGAIGAVEVLGQIGDVSLLEAADGQPRLIASLLRHENRRLRFAAAGAILQLDPQGPYPGSSYLAETLAYLARMGSARRVLIAHPRTDYGQSIVGLLAQLGFEADTAQTGNQAIQLAHASPDYQFVLIGDGIDRPPVAELLQFLRRDPRTRNLPVGVMARQPSARRMEHLTEPDPLAISFPRLHSEQGVHIQARRLLALAGRNRLGQDERLAHAEFSLTQMARLESAPERYSFYHFVQYAPEVEQALTNSQLTDAATTLLGLFATRNAQRALLGVANQGARPLLDRQAAAGAFKVSVERGGILLTRGEILSQYDRYNESAAAEAGIQGVLGSILDAIEAPSQSKPDAVTGAATEE